MKHKEHELVMLPTNQDDVNNKLFINTKSNKLFYRKYNLQQDTLYPMFQHLYILSDDEIKEDDWFISNLNEILKYTKKENKFVWYERLTVPGVSKVSQPFNIHINLKPKKIIATTDTHLDNEWSFSTKGDGKCNFNPKIAEIPESFIQYFTEQYNKGNVITEVNVEYEKINEKNPTLGKYGTIANGGGFDLKLIINPDNTISIKPIKDNWNRDEVVRLIMKYALDEHSVVISPKLSKWIKQNL